MKKLTPLKWLIYFTCAITLTVNAAAPSSLTTQELQWVLAVPDAKWTITLKGVARLLEDKKYTEADTMLNKALESNFEQTMFSLPAYENFIYRYAKHDFTTVFAAHLRQFPADKRLHILSTFNLRNVAVRNTGINVLTDWWNEDRPSMSNWMLTTSGFFEDIYLETFAEKALKTQDDFNDLANIYFALNDHDERRKKYFTQVIEYWIESDFNQAENYLNAIHGTLAGDPDMAFDRAALTMAYRMNLSNNFSGALAWAEKIAQPSTREWLLRDLSLEVNNKKEHELFINWLAHHPFEIEEAQQATYQNLQLLDLKKEEQ